MSHALSHSLADATLTNPAAPSVGHLTAARSVAIVLVVAIEIAIFVALVGIAVNPGGYAPGASPEPGIGPAALAAPVASR